VLRLRLQASSIIHRHPQLPTSLIAHRHRRFVLPHDARDTAWDSRRAEKTREESPVAGSASGTAGATTSALREGALSTGQGPCTDGPPHTQPRGALASVGRVCMGTPQSARERATSEVLTGRGGRAHFSIDQAVVLRWGEWISGFWRRGTRGPPRLAGRKP